MALTGHALAGHAEGARRAGCDAFVTKPCLPDELVEVIHKLLATRAPSAPPRSAWRVDPAAFRRVGRTRTPVIVAQAAADVDGQRARGRSSRRTDLAHAGQRRASGRRSGSDTGERRRRLDAP